jgi:uncharacterized protein (TIGR03435 family)
MVFAAAALIFAGVLDPPCLRAQALPSTSASEPAFEVASVKLSPSHSGIRGHGFPGDRFEATNVPVRDLILVAYGEPGRSLPDPQLSGGPSWIDTDRFDVSAKTDAANAASVPAKQLMLRRLLADRFKLVTHTALVDVPMYALVLARSNGALGPQLRRSEANCGIGEAGSVPPRLQPGETPRCVLAVVPPGTLTIHGQTMSTMAFALTRTLNRPVVDRTGLTGAFDADAQFNPDGLPGWLPAPAGTPSSDAPAFFEALQEQLGLKLESTRGQVEMIVIDHIEPPTPD